MREYAAPATVPVPTTGNLTDDVVRNAAEAPDAVVLLRRDAVSGDSAAWSPVTAAGFLAQVRAVAQGLVASGVEAGDRVAIIARTRWEWTVADYAIWFAGAVGVPVYDSAPHEQVEWILRDSGAVAVVVEGAEQAARISAARGELPDLRHVWSLDDGALDVLARLGADVVEEVAEVRRRQATPLDLATILYTSGTTGRPKGCMLTHGNFMAELAVTLAELDGLFGSGHAEGAGDSGDSGDAGSAPGEGTDAPDGGGAPDDDAPVTLLVLPLAHVLARIIQVGCIRSRTRLAHAHDVRRLSEDLAEVRPTFLLGVPRVLEKLANRAAQEATADGRGTLFQRATDAAIAWSRAEEQGRVPLRVRAQRAAYDRLVYRQVRARLGGRCRVVVSGGAPLGERLAHFFRGAGVTVLEGWGLTETTGAVTVNTPDALRVGTVGRPLPGSAVRVSEDGELLVSGPQVFAGYWCDEAATAAALERDGWLHTGDVGEVDDEGFVRVTGRKNEILVTAGGKNVAPALLEERVRAHPLVSQCLVVGDGRPYVAALVTLDAEHLAQWRSDRGRSNRPVTDDPDVLAAVQEAVDAANAAVSQAESIRRFRVLARDWTEESGHLTPSLKLKRAVVTRDFRREIDLLYPD